MRVKKSFVFLQLSFPFFTENSGSRTSVRSARLSFQSIIVVFALSFSVFYNLS